METGKKEAVQGFASGHSVLMLYESGINNYLSKYLKDGAVSMSFFPDCSGRAKGSTTQLISMNGPQKTGFCINALTEYPDDAAKLAIAYARQINEKNVSEYGLFNMLEGESHDEAQTPGLSRQLVALVEEKNSSAPLWYSLLSSDKASKFCSLTKKLTANVITAQEFTEMSAPYLTFE